MTPAEVWAKIDRISRIECCYAHPSERCAGGHPQGTRVVFGYEALSGGVQAAIHGARNTALDEAIGEVSTLVATEGTVLKSNVLEILSHLKLPNA